VEAWKVVMGMQHGPALLVLSRQASPRWPVKNMRRLRASPRAHTFLPTRPGGKAYVILMASGSEVYLCVDAYEKLKAKESTNARCRQHAVVEIFEKQEQPTGKSVLPSIVSARVSVELGATLGWERYVGLKGQMIGMHPVSVPRLPGRTCRRSLDLR